MLEITSHRSGTALTHLLVFAVAHDESMEVLAVSTQSAGGITSLLVFNDLAELRDSWDLSLSACNRMPKTISSYLEALDLYRAFAVEAQLPTTVDAIRREHIEMFMADQLARWKPKTAQVRYGNLLQFFKWAVEEELLTTSPMANMKPPSVPEVPVDVVSLDDLSKLMDACNAKDHDGLRDTAILRVFFDCGVRLGEVAGLTMEDVVLKPYGELTVTGKGARPRSVGFSVSTAQALDRYMRLRRAHAYASRPELWLGARGPLTSNGIAQMLRRRCAQAGIGQLHPHQLRHTAAHIAASHGARDSDMMRKFGWRSPQMLARYGASAADERSVRPSDGWP